MRRVAIALLSLTACHNEFVPSDGEDAAVAPSFASLYPAFLDPDARADTDAAGSHDSYFPRMACAGSKVYVVWADVRTTAKSDIYFNASTDGGITWNASDLRLDSGTGDSFQPYIACAGSILCVVWCDDRTVQYKPDVYFVYSTDGGQTWSAEARLNTPTAGTAISTDVRIAASGTNVCVAWMDRRSGWEDIYCRASSDGGQTWAGEERVDLGDAAGSTESLYPAIAADGSTVAVAWHDNRGGDFQAYANVSVDGGQTWLASALQISSGSNGGVWPQPAVQGTSIHIAWQDWRNTIDYNQSDIFVRSSSDSGQSWGSETMVDSDLAGYSDVPRIAASGSRVYVAWGDWRSEWHSYVARSDDGGATWQPELKVDGSVESGPPEICADGANAFVVYPEWDGSDNDIYLARSTDGGATWSAPFRVDQSPDVTSGLANLQVATSGGWVWLAWAEDRTGSGKQDVFCDGSAP